MPAVSSSGEICAFSIACGAVSGRSARSAGGSSTFASLSPGVASRRESAARREKAVIAVELAHDVRYLGDRLEDFRRSGQGRRSLPGSHACASLSPRAASRSRRPRRRGSDRSMTSRSRSNFLRRAAAGIRTKIEQTARLVKRMLYFPLTLLLLKRFIVRQPESEGLSPPAQRPATSLKDFHAPNLLGYHQGRSTGHQRITPAMPVALRTSILS